MTVGPGRYNDVAEYVRIRTQARGLVLVIFEGDRGEGFEVQVADPVILKALPRLLREMADSIEGDIERDLHDL